MRVVVTSSIAVLVVLVLHLHTRSRDPAVAERPCTHAVMVDGILRCDADAPRTLGELCGAIDTRDRVVMAGDAIDTIRACAIEAPRGGLLGWGRMQPADLRALQQPVDLNAADVDELRSLPGIGHKIAARIVEGRPYRDPDELVRVRGIGRKTMERIRERLVVRP